MRNFHYMDAKFINRKFYLLGYTNNLATIIFMFIDYLIPEWTTLGFIIDYSTHVGLTDRTNLSWQLFYHTIEAMGDDVTLYEGWSRR